MVRCVQLVQNQLMTVNNVVIPKRVMHVKTATIYISLLEIPSHQPYVKNAKMLYQVALNALTLPHVVFVTIIPILKMDNVMLVRL